MMSSIPIQEVRIQALEEMIQNEVPEQALSTSNSLEKAPNLIHLSRSQDSCYQNWNLQLAPFAASQVYSSSQ